MLSNPIVGRLTAAASTALPNWSTCASYLQTGESISFFWKFAGIGTERCFHDDKEIPKCESGLTIEAADLSHQNTQHTFRVEFKDVCGNTKEAEYSYTQQGVQALSKVDYIPVETSDVRHMPPVTAKQPKNSAAAAAPAGLLASLALLLALAML